MELVMKILITYNCAKGTIDRYRYVNNNSYDLVELGRV
jgi:hypothetical protein